MRICFLSLAHPSRDKRVFDKQAVSLAAAGHQVVHLAPGPEESRELERGVTLVTYSRHPGLVGRLRAMPALFARARRLGADCFHANEVDSWVLGALLKAVTGARLVFDVHEIYPAEFAESRFPPAARPAVAGAVRALMRLLARVTDRIVLAKDSAATDFAGFEAKTVIVRNYVPLAYTDCVPERRAAPGPGPLTAIHLGVMCRPRGWPELLAAVAQCSTPSKVVLLGSFDQDREEFLRQAATLNLAERFELVDWLPFSQAIARVAAADCGLVLFQPGRLNHVHALPHKMFDYMLAGIPIIAPAFALEVARIVTEADCGILVDPANPGDIAAALDRLAADPAERARLGRNGRQAVLSRYNWEREADTLLALYAALGPKRAA